MNVDCIAYKVFDNRVRSRLFSFKNRRIELEQIKNFATIVFWHQSIGMPNFIQTRGTVDMPVHQ